MKFLQNSSCMNFEVDYTDQQILLLGHVNKKIPHPKIQNPFALFLGAIPEVI